MSCLFDSLEYFLKIPSKEIRTKICDYLTQDNDLMEGFNTTDLLEIESIDYIKKMRKSSTWGGGIEIKSACNIWNLRIFLINVRKSDKVDKTNPYIEFLPNKNNKTHAKTIYLTWNGFHYEPIKNIQDLKYSLDKLIAHSTKKKEKNSDANDLNVKKNYKDDYDENKKDKKDKKDKIDKSEKNKKKKRKSNKK